MQKNVDSNVNRDMYIPNPSNKDMDKYEWIGKVMGACLRGRESLVSDHCSNTIPHRHCNVVQVKYLRLVLLLKTIITTIDCTLTGFVCVLENQEIMQFYHSKSQS